MKPASLLIWHVMLSALALTFVSSGPAALGNNVVMAPLAADGSLAVALASEAPDPIPTSFTVAMALSQPITSFTTESLVVSNARPANPWPLRVQMTIAAGSLHSVAVRENGTVAAWGRNDSGQCNVPANLAGVVAVACGNDHALALKSDGTVVAWGKNDYGQCNVPAGLQNVVAIACGYYHSLALKADGTVAAWGRNDSGQCNVPAIHDAIAVYGGLSYSVVLRPGGKVQGWGTSGASPITFPADLANAVAVAAGTVLCSDGTTQPPRPMSFVPTAIFGHIRSISAHGGLAYVLDNSRISLFGFQPSIYNDYLAKATSGYSAVSAGEYLILALRLDGAAEVWAGSNYYGQRDVPPGLKVRQPACSVWQFDLLPTATGVVTAQLPAGAVQTPEGTLNEPSNVVQRNFRKPGALQVTIEPAQAVTQTAAWRREGTRSWNKSGTTEQYLATGTRQIEFRDLTLHGFKKPSASASLTSETTTPILARYEALPVTCTLVSPAANTVYGKFPVIAKFNMPVQGVSAADLRTSYATVSNLRPLAKHDTIVAQEYHCVALLRDGSAIAWGGDLAPEVFAFDRYAPVDSDGLIAISGSLGFVMGLKADGTVRVWSRGFSEDGKGGIIGSSNPPAGLRDVVAISCGAYHCSALKADGTIALWGQNPYHECDAPAGLRDVVAISAGRTNSGALRADGTVVVWGSNYYGQNNVPPDLRDVVAFDVGDLHCAALRADGTVVAWGSNRRGQLDVPAGLNNVVDVKACADYCLALKADGTVTAWGGYAPLPAGLNNVVEIAAHDEFAYAVHADGSVTAWGNVKNMPAGLSVKPPTASWYRLDLTPTAAGMIAARMPAAAAASLGMVPSQSSNVLTRNYVLPGRLTVTVTPAAAVTAGAQWRRVGSGVWLNSGAADSNVPAGDQWIEFKEITGWIRPPNVLINLSSGQSMSISRNYADPRNAVPPTEWMKY